MALVNDRKSLMLDKTEYNAISALAKKGGVARPLVIQALLLVADEAKVVAKLQEVRASAKADAAEERKKRQALASLASDLDMGQIEKLLASLQEQQNSNNG